MTLMRETAKPRLICVQTTFNETQAANDFASRLVEAGLAACVQMSPVHSVYCWQGSVEREEEVLLSIKTTGDRLADLEAFVAAHHPYDEPEFIALQVFNASAGYAAWVETQTGREGS
ncbi:MAG: divalent-cation tolerance protein CutA [Pseudomonadota bacterium]